MALIFCDSRSLPAARTRKGINTMRHHNTLLHGLLQFIPWIGSKRLWTSTARTGACAS